MRNWRSWARAVAVIAAAQAALGGIGLLLLSPDLAVGPWVRLLQILIFASCGGFLLVGMSRDARPAYLGAGLVLIASCYAQPGLSVIASDGPVSLRIIAGALGMLRMDALLPLFVWLFAREFPESLESRTTRTLGALGVSVSAVVGLLFLILVPAGPLRLPGVQSVGSWEFLTPRPTSTYWVVTFGLTGAALLLVVLRARTARPAEKRRVALFVACLTVQGAIVVAVVVLGALSARFAGLFVGPTATRWALPAAQLVIAMLPPALTYAVVVQRAFALRLLFLRTAYVGARLAAALIQTLPVFAISWILYRARDARVAELASGRNALYLILTGALAILSWRMRVPAVQWIDRLFFREQYEAHRILAALTSRSRSMSSGSTRDAAISFATEIDRALHLDRVEVMPADPLRRELCSPRGLAPALGFDSVLARQMTRSHGPLLVDLELGGETVDALPESERQWLATAGFRLVVPMLGSGGDLIGCIGLGMKKSEADWSRDDFELLEAAAGAAGLALENQVLRGSGRDSRASGGIVAASECPACRRVVPASDDVCAVCGTELAPSPLPTVLFGKFRLESRIGTGATGVVFRATDLDLDRAVAIKTLPRLSPRNALRLKREARTLAAISHAHLATIYGAETWQDIPLLVLEYLAGGTLESRIREHPLSERDTLALGIAMADVLDRLHSAGLLHRDIKPSNVAYTDDGVPKLLDFDLARILSETAVVPAVDETDPDADPTVPGRSLGSYSGVAGTPLYMSPEAMYGQAPDVSFDLWGASVTLYEAVTGTHPFVAASWGASMARISEARCRDVREGAPECSERFASFFRDALARDPRRRPASARDMRRRLLECAA